MRKRFKMLSLFCLSLAMIIYFNVNISNAQEKQSHSLNDNVVRLDVYKYDNTWGNVGSFWGDFKFLDMGDGSVRLRPTSGGNIVDPSSINSNIYLSSTTTFKYIDNNGYVYKSRTFMAGHSIRELAQEMGSVKLRYGLDRLQIITDIPGATKRLAILGTINNNLDNYDYANVIRPERSKSYRFRIERDGLYAEYIDQVKISDGEYLIETGNNANRVLDKNDYNNIIRNIGVKNYSPNSESQKFRFEYDNKKSAYKIRIGEQLLTWNSTSDNNVIYYYDDGAANQCWYLQKGDNGRYKIVSAKDTNRILNLDVDAKNISVAERRNNINQQFNIVSPLAERVFTISSKLNNNKVLDINNDNANIKNNVTIWDKLNGKNQKWTLEYNPSKNAYKIKSELGDNLVLAWNRYRNGTNVFAHKFEGKDEHYWVLDITSDNYYTLKSYYRQEEMPRYLDLYDSNTTNGTNIQMSKFTGRDNQKFTFTR